MVSMVLQHKLEILEKYLTLEANELIFTKSGEFYVDYGDRFELIEDKQLDYEFLNDFLVQLATRRNQRFNESYPSLSCELPEPYLRYRVQAQHESVLFGSDVCICIRIPSKTRFDLESFMLSDTLLQEGWTHKRIKDFIHDKKNVLVSGGTGSGKTSFLNSLMQEIPINDRVVTIEDSQELFVANPNKTQLAVPKDEKSIYTYTTAINNAMRLRPDRLFLGEIDIRNTLTFLRVNNTGHSGNLSTLHANNSEDAINAIITNSMFGGMNDREALKDYIRSAIDYIVQIERIGKQRKIVEILNVKEYIRPSNHYKRVKSFQNDRHETLDSTKKQIEGSHEPIAPYKECRRESQQDSTRRDSQDSLTQSNNTDSHTLQSSTKESITEARIDHWVFSH
ncbi:conjugal transfer protein [Helicobacter didelphidarum]|uniref:Conjugal transfer protein n=1 Tax=Helicobacter didelphidarum TaxID=2040648 RepID=A0A3D8IK88_9HELI|nr:ATPase, T2SS/T4P/T4SS family [Helicobacter didelphidarum]RDU65767.1 conjugal transfer protein [Helicobacter didelphidarum]